MISIRQETSANFSDVYNLVRAAFENEEFSDKDEHNLVNRLRKSENFVPQLSLVAFEDRQIVGYILFTEIKVGDTTLLALAPVAVSPIHQKGGIGSKLILEGHSIAKKMGYVGCVVLGHNKYYPNFGYVNASQFNIKAPFDVSDDNFMAIPFIKNSLDTINGTVQYAKEFFE